MANYYKNTFYKTNHLTLQQKKDLIIDSVNNSFKWHIDELVGFQRQQIEMTVEDILSKLTNDSHFVFIQRRGFESWKESKCFETTWCLETGFEESGYYIFVFMKNEYLDFFINKYKLQIMV